MPTRRRTSHLERGGLRRRPRIHRSTLMAARASTMWTRPRPAERRPPGRTARGHTAHLGVHGARQVPVIASGNGPGGCGRLHRPLDLADQKPPAVDRARDDDQLRRVASPVSLRGLPGSHGLNPANIVSERRSRGRGRPCDTAPPRPGIPGLTEPPASSAAASRGAGRPSGTTFAGRDRRSGRGCVCPISGCSRTASHGARAPSPSGMPAASTGRRRACPDCPRSH